MPNEVTVLYHDDADGFASAYALWLTHKDTANYIAVQYSQPVPEIPEGTKILYVVDFSYKREICEELVKKYQVHIYDHHKTAEKELEGLDYATFDPTLSGCGLVWNTYYSRPMPELLRYVQDRDLWKFELPYSDIINMCIATLPHDFALWQAHCNSADFFPNAFAAGSAIKAFRDGQIKAALRDVRIMRLHFEEGTYYEIPVVNCSANVSEVGNVLCAEYPDAPFSASYCDRRDVRSWSLRSVGEFDVSAIARMFGGGGHRNAAGFSTDIGWPQHTSDEFIKAFESAAGKLDT